MQHRLDAVCIWRWVYLPACLQTYLTVSRYSTSVFTCIELANGVSVLKVYPGLVCGSAEHTARSKLHNTKTHSDLRGVLRQVYMVLGVVGSLVYLVRACEFAR